MGRFTVLIFCLLGVGCRIDEFDAKSFAEEYCSCMETQRLLSDFYDAQAKCDGMMLHNSKYYGTFYLENTNGPYSMFYPDSYVDSVKEFHSEFERMVKQTCCQIAIDGCGQADSIQVGRLKQDSLYKVERRGGRIQY